MTPKAFEIVYLDPQAISFERHGDTLSLRLADGTVYPRVVLRSCFPVSDSQKLLSVRDATGDDQQEIGVIADWSQLSDGDREAVASELSLHYFVPHILQVTNIKEELGFLYWTVSTDKGDKEFVMRNSVIHYAREVSAGRWLLIDVNDARYEIPSLDVLDVRSQKLVQRFLSI